MTFVKIDITHPVRRAFEVLDDNISNDTYDDLEIIRLAFKMVNLSSVRLNKKNQSTPSSAESVRFLLKPDVDRNHPTTSNDDLIADVIISQLAPELHDVVYNVVGEDARLVAVGDINLQYSSSRNLYATAILEIRYKENPL